MNHSARRINALATALDVKRYLEIGVNYGLTFRDVNITDRTAVDPIFLFDVKTLENESTRFCNQTSDIFFSNRPDEVQYDIIFIDGLHTFEQVLRDITNAILCTHMRSVLILDDTLPTDIYSAIPNQSDALHRRKTAGGTSTAWHGDVFKTIFFIHDFWPSLNYLTIVDSGNPQTLIWRSNAFLRTPLFNDLEKISRLTFFDLQDHLNVLRQAGEEEAIELCVREIRQGSVSPLLNRNTEKLALQP